MSLIGAILPGPQSGEGELDLDDDLLAQLGWQAGDAVNLIVEEGRIIVQKRYDKGGADAPAVSSPGGGGLCVSGEGGPGPLPDDGDPGLA